MAGRSVGAGTVTVTGGSGPPVEIGETDAGPYTYPSVSFPGREWNVGDELLVSASGDTVPSFSARVELPPGIVLTEPVPPDGGSLAVSRGGLTFRWSGAGDGTVTVSLDPAAGSSTFVTCHYPVGLSTATIPSEVLGLYPPGQQVLIFVANGTEQLVQAGSYSVTVSTRSDPVGFPAVMQ